MTEMVQSFSFGSAWTYILSLILRKGKIVSPRNKSTKEIMNLSLTVSNGLYNIMENEVRDLNYRFMIAEWLWIEAGLSDVETLAQYNSLMREYSDDGQILNGAYGPRLHSQWQYIIEALKKSDTRQAVSVIWSPSPKDSKDIPCTISMQWLIRDDKLHCTVNMRSSDAWLGLPYDYFTFSQLTNVLASMLEISTGSITMNLASSHLYEEHWTRAFKALQVPTLIYESPRMPYVYLYQEEIKRILNREMVRELPFPVKQYCEALHHSKLHALEVLRELSPK